MGKKRDLANSHIVDLVSNLIGYMQNYVGSANCPYQYHLVGAENIEMPEDCCRCDCEKCKHDFWIHLESDLLEKNVVE